MGDLLLRKALGLGVRDVSLGRAPILGDGDFGLARALSPRDTARCLSFF
jgi:hypothetical protein